MISFDKVPTISMASPSQQVLQPLPSSACRPPMGHALPCSLNYPAHMAGAIPQNKRGPLDSCRNIQSSTVSHHMMGL